MDKPFGFGGIALSVIGAGFICLGIADFILYNFNIWDFYAAFNLYWLDPFTVIIAMAVGGMLAGAGTRRVGLPAPVQWVLFSFASLFLLIIVGSSLVSGLVSGGYDHLSIVRYGSFYDCPAYTLDELANATFDDPEWESLIADDGYAYVNLSGWLSRDNLPVHTLLQFRIEDDEFVPYACEIDGVPQNDLVASQVINLLCSSR